MIIEGTLKEISATWIAVTIEGATQPIRIPISVEQAREIGGALGRGLRITIEPNDVPVIIDDAPTIPFSAAHMHARMIADTAASLDVKALARVVDTVITAVNGVANAVTTEAAERKHDQGNTTMALDGLSGLIHDVRAKVEAPVEIFAGLPVHRETETAPIRIPHENYPGSDPFNPIVEFGVVELPPPPVVAPTEEIAAITAILAEPDPDTTGELLAKSLAIPDDQPTPPEAPPAKGKARRK